MYSSLPVLHNLKLSTPPPPPPKHDSNCGGGSASFFVERVPQDTLAPSVFCFPLESHDVRYTVEVMPFSVDDELNGVCHFSVLVSVFDLTRFSKEFIQGIIQSPKPFADVISMAARDDSSTIIRNNTDVVSATHRVNIVLSRDVVDVSASSPPGSVHSLQLPPNGDAESSAFADSLGVLIILTSKQHLRCGIICTPATTTTTKTTPSEPSLVFSQPRDAIVYAEETLDAPFGRVVELREDVDAFFVSSRALVDNICNVRDELAAKLGMMAHHQQHRQGDEGDFDFDFLGVVELSDLCTRLRHEIVAMEDSNEADEYSDDGANIDEDTFREFCHNAFEETQRALQRTRETMDGNLAEALRGHPALAVEDCVRDTIEALDAEEMTLSECLQRGRRLKRVVCTRTLNRLEKVRSQRSTSVSVSDHNNLQNVQILNLQYISNDDHTNNNGVSESFKIGLFRGNVAVGGVVNNGVNSGQYQEVYVRSFVLSHSSTRRAYENELQALQNPHLLGFVVPVVATFTEAHDTYGMLGFIVVSCLPHSLQEIINMSSKKDEYRCDGAVGRMSALSAMAMPTISLPLVRDVLLAVCGAVLMLHQDNMFHGNLSDARSYLLSPASGRASAESSCSSAGVFLWRFYGSSVSGFGGEDGVDDVDGAMAQDVYDLGTLFHTLLDALEGTSEEGDDNMLRDPHHQDDPQSPPWDYYADPERLERARVVLHLRGLANTMRTASPALRPEIREVASKVMILFSPSMSASSGAGAQGLCATPSPQRQRSLSPSSLTLSCSPPRGSVLRSHAYASLELPSSNISDDLYHDIVRYFDSRTRHCASSMSFFVPRRYVINGIYRVNNTTLWRNYERKRQEILSEQNKVGSPCCSPLLCEEEDGSAAPLTIDDAVNEVYLFHGTPHDRVEHICMHGFDERLSNLAGNYGGGVYFTSDVCKAHRYTKPGFAVRTSNDLVTSTLNTIIEQQQNDGSHCVFLSRVLLGDVFTTKVKLRGIRRPPENEHRRPYMYNSISNVVGKPNHPRTQQRQHKEYVIYDRHQAFPEFMILYSAQS
eukprot:PhM_4_TR12809/c0_g2_i1/m.21136